MPSGESVCVCQNNLNIEFKELNSNQIHRHLSKGDSDAVWDRRGSHRNGKQRWLRTVGLPLDRERQARSPRVAIAQSRHRVGQHMAQGNYHHHQLLIIIIFKNFNFNVVVHLCLFVFFLNGHWIELWKFKTLICQRDLRVPFGGMKHSGIGREGGGHSIDFYSEQKTICIGL